MTLTADVMFVSGILFLIIFSVKIRKITARYILSCTTQQLANSLTKAVNTYTRRGFVIDLALMDKEFEKIRDKLAIFEVNTTAAREHVPEIERQICLSKEHNRCTKSDFPFDPIPRLVIIYVVYTCVMWISAIPCTAGAVQGIPPHKIVTGRKVRYKRNYQACMGGYI